MAKAEVSVPQKKKDGEMEEWELDSAVQNFMEVEKIKADPKKFAKVKAHAKKKGEMYMSAFSGAETSEEPKSFDDLRKKRSEKIDEENEAEDS
jgi:hypothetical protein